MQPPSNQGGQGKPMKPAFIDPRAILAANVTLGHGSVISGPAQIASGVIIGHHVTIEGDVHIGENTRIDHHSVIEGPTRIGANNQFYPFCSIGLRAQHPDFHGEGGALIIGEHNVFREFITLNRSTYEAETIIGSRNYLMAYSHVAHDCRVGNDNKLANGATLAGHVVLGNGCYLGLHAIVHQRLAVGDLCMVGMNETITRNLPPYAVLAGGRFVKLNTRGMTLRGLSQQEIRGVEARYRSGVSDSPASVGQAAIDAFLASFHAGGCYRYERARSS
jgi:UDP-N-acetylglucosamine acyltransferase